MDSVAASKDVLVVDDEAAILLAVRAVLEHFGHRVTCALGGTAALQQMAAHRYDVIVTDIYMPDIDGAHLIREARRLAATARIVAISGGGVYMGAEETLQVAQRLGATAVLQKPFNPSEIMAAACPKSTSGQGTESSAPSVS